VAATEHPGMNSEPILSVWSAEVRTWLHLMRLVAIQSTLAALTATAPPASDAAKKPVDWFRSDEGRRVVGHVLSWQAEAGDWPKNTDTTAKPFAGDRANLRGTFDNGATTGELRLLARALEAGDDARCRPAFLRGLDHILAAQYPNGGWPQFHPPGTGYARHITFNDDTMVRLLEFLRETATRPDFAFVDPDRRRAAQAAFDRGIQCILRCQIQVQGRLTGWCAQHDATTFEPRGARSYELPSLSGAESAKILELLMSLERPDAAVRRAVTAGAEWFTTARLTGVRQAVVNGDKRLVPDPDAPPLWARFYDLETGRPFYCGRDGVKKSDFAAIEAERRNGYAWHGNWGERVATAYAKWRERNP